MLEVLCPHSSGESESPYEKGVLNGCVSKGCRSFEAVLLEGFYVFVTLGLGGLAGCYCLRKVC